MKEAKQDRTKKKRRSSFLRKAVEVFVISATPVGCVGTGAWLCARLSFSSFSWASSRGKLADSVAAPLFALTLSCTFGIASAQVLQRNQRNHNVQKRGACERCEQRRGRRGGQFSVSGKYSFRHNMRVLEASFKKVKNSTKTVSLLVKRPASSAEQGGSVIRLQAVDNFALFGGCFGLAGSFAGCFGVLRC